jgi:hypothetical protein
MRDWKSLGLLLARKVYTVQASIWHRVEGRNWNPKTIWKGCPKEEYTGKT